MKKLVVILLVAMIAWYGYNLYEGYSDYRGYVEKQAYERVYGTSGYKVGASIVMAKYGEYHKVFEEFEVIENSSYGSDVVVMRLKKPMNIFEFMTKGREYNRDKHYDVYVMTYRKE